MLVSTIISSGRSLANAPSTTMYTDTEALRAVNNSWIDIYAKLTENNDDFFVTLVNPATVSAVTGWQNVYEWTIPATFYRLRLVKYQRSGANNWVSVDKMSLEDLADTQNAPGYRIVGQKLWIYDPAYPNTYQIWYYPVPQTLTLTPDVNLTYPESVPFEIMSYQVAVEIRRKLGLDTVPLEQRKAELLQSMLMAIDRDQFKAQPIQNVFPSVGPWR